jgi:hypothetical protein
MKQNNHTEQSPNPSSKQLHYNSRRKKETFLALQKPGSRPNKIKVFTWDNIINWITELAPFYEEHHLISAWNRLLDEFACGGLKDAPIARQIFLHILGCVPKGSARQAYTTFLILYQHHSAEQKKWARELFLKLCHQHFNADDNGTIICQVLSDIIMDYGIEEKPKIWQIFLCIAYQNLQYRESIWGILIYSIKEEDINNFKRFLYDSYIGTEDWFPKYMQALNYIEGVRPELKDRLFINPLFNPIKIIGATNDEQSGAIPTESDPTAFTASASPPDSLPIITFDDKIAEQNKSAKQKYHYKC